MSEDTEILDERYVDPVEFVENGEKIYSSEEKAVYRLGGSVLKVLENEKISSMKRLGAYLPENLSPPTSVKKEDLSDSSEYNGHYTVVHQEVYDEKFVDRLNNSEKFQDLGDFIYVLDSILDQCVVMADPVVENFNYFGQKLKPNDLCDISSLKKFPHSFYEGEEVKGYQEEVEHMYREAIISVEHETSLKMEEVAQIFEETSMHIESIDIVPEWPIEEVPEVEVSDRIAWESSI